MKLDDKKTDPNSLLIPRDIATRSKSNYARAGERSSQKALDEKESLSDTCTTIKEPRKKSSVAKTNAGKEAENKRLAEESFKRQEEERKETELRVRARDLQDQIRWWESQRDQGGYDDCMIDAIISDLKNQLSGIDGKYW